MIDRELSDKVLHALQEIMDKSADMNMNMEDHEAGTSTTTSDTDTTEMN